MLERFEECVSGTGNVKSQVIEYSNTDRSITAIQWKFSYKNAPKGCLIFSCSISFREQMSGPLPIKFTFGRFRLNINWSVSCVTETDFSSRFLLTISVTFFKRNYCSVTLSNYAIPFCT